MVFLRWWICARWPDADYKASTDYKSFGVMLLEDSSGEKINTIEREKRGDVADIIHEILRVWLQGRGKQPVTWNTFACVLESIQRYDLAEMIMHHLQQ